MGLPTDGHCPHYILDLKISLIRPHNLLRSVYLVALMLVSWLILVTLSHDLPRLCGYYSVLHQCFQLLD
jgi:hypothetical protein